MAVNRMRHKLSAFGPNTTPGQLEGNIEGGRGGPVSFSPTLLPGKLDFADAHRLLLPSKKHAETLSY